MKKVKKLFTYIIMAFSLMGIFFGSILTGENHEQTPKEASAVFSTYNSISNSLPQYLKVGEDYGNDINEIFLLSSSQNTTSIEMATDLTVPNAEDKSNPAYFTQVIPEGEIPQEYYYFDFTTSLSLYRNLSNTEIQSGMTGTNLLQDQPIANYTTNGEFSIESGGVFTPKKLGINISLNTVNESIQFDGNKITLNEEGLYTLVIPAIVYYTNNSGATFASLAQTDIYYTFMVFNASTYFKSAGDQNVQNVDFYNAQLSNVISSDTYSKYHFYNYSSSSEGALPTLNYDHRYFKVSIKHIDVDNQSQTIHLEYQNGNLVYLDSTGAEISDTSKLPISACVLADDTTTSRVSFKDLGEYDISFEYLYIVEHGQTTVTYKLPIDENETEAYQNKNQKVFIYGYQAMFADYLTLDPNTNQTTDAELKTFELGADQDGVYKKSADITSALNSYYYKTTNKKIDATKSTEEIILDGVDGNASTNPTSNSSYIDDVKKWATNYINQKDGSNFIVEPVSTNQPPIKFITNATLPDGHGSKIYKVTNNNGTYTLDSGTDFQGFNQNTAGTYLYIIQYTYNQFMTPSGTLNSATYHYQVFYFTITSTIPSVTVLSADYDESAGEYENFSELYTRGFTNKSVFVLNNAKNNDFDAVVKIRLSAYNYVTGTYYFQDRLLEDLQSFDSALEYKDYKYNWNNTANLNKDNYETKYGVLISNQASYANAKWTISIESATTSTPSVQTFTIDTYDITNVKANNAEKTDSSYYILDTALSASNITNRPIAMSWSEKRSGAITYGYLKHVPFTTNNWTDGKDENALSNLLQQYLYRDVDMLPTTSKIDLAGVSKWGSYANAGNFGTQIPSTSVRTANGIYILQVYDQAGNYTFEIFMVDQTAPIFVQVTEASDFDTYQLIQNGTSISVPQDDFTTVSIRWASYKGISLSNQGKSLDSYLGYEHSGIKDASFKEKFETFIDNNSKYVQNQGYFFTSKISDTIYVKSQGQSTYSAQSNTEHSYQINFFKQVNGQKEANEGSCKIVLRDSSNGYVFSDQYYAYLNYPSSYLSFNISSDMTKFTIYNGDESLEGEAYSQIADLYLKDGMYTTDSSGTDSEYRKKFAYLPSVNTTQPLSISFIPKVDNGLKLGIVNVKYYPYITTSSHETGSLTTTDDEGTQTTQTITNHYFYKDIASDPSLDLDMFEWDDNAVYEGVVELDLAFGQTSKPLAGKYVITRQYVDDSSLASSITEAYDFFSRTITFYVDTNGLISPLEEVKTADGKYSAFESVVGGEILINTHAGANNNGIAISFPTMKEFGDGNYLNSGSFYTQSTFESTTSSVSISRDTNKLPVELYIPKYKYTIKNDKVYHEDEKGNDVYDNLFNLTYNDELSFYGNVIVEKMTDASDLYQIVLNNQIYDGENYVNERIVLETSLSYDKAYEYLYNNLSMTAYEISAEITFTDASGKTYYYASKRTAGDTYHLETVEQTGNDYLAFYECPNGLGNGYGNLVSSFSKVGKYSVTIYQSGNDPLSSIYNFYRLSFEITADAPEFDIIDQDSYILEKAYTDSNGIEIYYTNSDSLTIQWEDPTDPYFAKVDQTKISIGGNTNHTYDINDDNAPTYTITIPEGCVDAFRENGLSITFQYEGHNDNYYKTTTKRIFFDTQAPTDNLYSLMEKTELATEGVFSQRLQKREMRVYTDYRGNVFDPTTTANEEKALTEASYITNVGSGVFGNYAFVVEREYFETVFANSFKDNAEGKKVPVDGEALSELYFNPIANITSYTQSNQYTFLNSFTKLSGIIDFSIEMPKGGEYYEIIEVDWAGNRTIYVVYVLDEADDNQANTSNNAITYRDSKSDGVDEIVTSENIDNTEAGFNIYANSGFYISDLNYNQDPWLYFTATINGQKATYFKSPLLSGKVYQITNDGNGNYVYTQKDLTEITTIEDSSDAKHNIIFSNRTLGQTKTCYMTVMDASLIINKVTTNVASDTASVSINVPTTAEYNSTQKGYIFPTKVDISQYSVKGEWESFASFEQGNYGEWATIDPDNSVNDSAVTFNYQSSSYSNQLVISVDTGLENQKIKFVITDNFGGTATTIILTGNAIDEDWATSGSRFYIVEEADGLAYIASDEVSYIFNHQLYKVVPTNIHATNINKTVGEVSNEKTGLTTLTFSPEAGKTYYDGAFLLEVYDESTWEEGGNNTPIKKYYVRITNTLPSVDKNSNSVAQGGIIFLDKKHINIGADNIKADTDPRPLILTVKMDGITYSGPATTLTTYSRNVTVSYHNGTIAGNLSEESYLKTLTYSGYITSDDGATWTRIDDIEAEQALTSYIISGEGRYILLIKYDDSSILTDNYKLFEINILDSESSYYYITVNGQTVEKSTGIKYSYKDQEYEVTYIVALEYADKYNGGLVIHENKELEVSISKQRTIYLGQELEGEANPAVPRGTIVTEIYSYSCEESKGDFVVIFIPLSDNIVGTLNYELPDRNVSLKDGSNQIVVPHRVDQADFNRLKISFTSYYGVEQNKIVPVVYKLLDGVPVQINCKTYQSSTSASISYIYLETAGTYYLQILDSCTPANSQAFGGKSLYGHDYVEITFLPSVPFDVITTNDAGEKVVTAPVQRAIYNSSVTLQLTNISTYYSPSAELSVVATRNGKSLTVSAVNHAYTFTTPGYYTVEFNAIASNGVPIRLEKYSFTIINKNESRYAFEFSEYGNYYVEKVVKDGVDVTQDLIDIANFKTITINNKKYLSSISLNYLDQKTGRGRYEITININNPSYSAVTGESFTFGLWINMATPPLTVSIDEGASTSDVITVRFNPQTLYNTIGDCYIKVGGLREDFTSENIASFSGSRVISISAAGTYYIQVYTQSGQLLYSYKVTKTEPLNSFAILAIVLGVIALAAVIFITVKLRKRQKVK